jgi:hypothetical protein
MSVRIAIFTLILCMLFAAPAVFAQVQKEATPAATDDGVIGTILEVEGTATLTPDGGTATAAAVNSPVHMKDVIATGPQSRVFVLLIDNTQWTLSENTQIRVDEWAYDPDDSTNNRGRYSVIAGAFQYISGLLAKKPDPDVRIDTPAGSIGIRGTDITGGDVDGEYGIEVDEGAIDVATDKGQVRVNTGEGTTIKGRGFAPGRPAAFSQKRLQRLRNMVFLKNREQVKQRMGMMQERHKLMRENFKRYMMTHPQQRRQLQQRMQQNQWQQRQGGQQQQGNGLRKRRRWLQDGQQDQ